MPQDEASRPKESKPQPTPASLSWLTTPKPIKRLFDKFPLITYPANQLPQRKPIERTVNTLYIFAREEDAQIDSPSFNPSCLKWQTYLHLANIPFTTVPSSNHASPTGSLPFLNPASFSTNHETIRPIPSSKLQEWAAKNGSALGQETEDMRYEAYMSLLDNTIRNAWLYHLYLSPSNFASIACPLYITPTTTSSMVHLSLSYTLQTAARAEIVKSSSSPVVEVDSLYRESDKAFSALSELLGDSEWFFGEKMPGLMDASVFAYSHLLLDDELMGWKAGDEGMGEGLRDGRWKNLADHRQRIYEVCYQ
ncbi:MAG: hypothetical protein LQ346_004472 [Caloplaca aetnensis]|nr:MAG: hypothetical protein LQ346_004472 [Caloplaca aetnensis]